MVGSIKYKVYILLMSRKELITIEKATRHLSNVPIFGSWITSQMHEQKAYYHSCNPQYRMRKKLYINNVKII